ncbi:hypothetical protein EIP86_011437 [Pleurotus ostreatoroseus]|nr:hypothetical protein EIP86_011437 [Pleurotus ostreatoroseus]
MNTPETSKYEEKPALTAINDDTLIHIFSFMNIEDILAMRQVSSRMRTVSRLRIVWQRALRTHVLDRGFPFPSLSQNLALEVEESTLEALTRRAYALGQFWQRPQEQNRTHMGVKRACTFVAGSSATGVAQVRFLPTRPGCVVALSKGIWSVLTCWDVGIAIKGGQDAGGMRGRAVRVAEWAPRQTLITSLAVNEDPCAEACLAVSITYSGSNAQTVQIMTVDQDAGMFVTLCTLEIPFRAMTLRKDILAASDDVNETHIINWRTQEYAVLWGSDEPSEHNFQVMYLISCESRLA